MDTFYITYQEFWDRFDRDGRPEEEDKDFIEEPPVERVKRLKVEEKSKRYVILYGRRKPGKKNKVWEKDGFLTLVGQMAHLSDLRGRLLEEPTLLDELELKTIQDLGELTIGDTEVQVIELDIKQ